MRIKYLPLLLLTVIASLFSHLHSAAQSGPYGNEWIDFSKTYVKFKIAHDGIYRITRADMDTAGIPSTTLGANFSLWRDGQEVAIFVSNTGAMTSTDYVEFWGTRANGTLDKELFTDPTSVADDRTSLFTDTAAYFLTYDQLANHKRYLEVTNAIPSPAPTPEPYCFALANLHGRAVLSEGPNYIPLGGGGETFCSSRFEPGEAWVGAQFFYNTNTDLVFSAVALPYLMPNVAGATLNMGFAIQAIANNPENHSFGIKINGAATTPAVADLGALGSKIFSDISIPTGTLSVSPQFEVTAATPAQFANSDQFGITFIEINYPRAFNVGGYDFMQFNMPANTSQQYLEFSNLVYGTSTPKLYDITNQQWYTGIPDPATYKVHFYINASFVKRDLIVFAGNSTSITNLKAIKTFQFTDFSKPANQGNYVIISHKMIMGPGTNVQAYADYRSSTAGGSYHTTIADITELYDQFAYGYETHPMSIRHFLKFGYDHWSTNLRPQYAFLIGHGILYYKYQDYWAGATTTYNFPLVPTYGELGSDVDFVNWGDLSTAKIAISRLSVWNNDEVGIYLTKVKNYELAQQPVAFPTPATELWKKQVLHVIGGSDGPSGPVTLQGEEMMSDGNDGYPVGVASKIIEDSLTGKSVFSVKKTSTAYVDAVNSQKVDSLVSNGVSMITFFGHASSSGFDYNLNDPTTYHSAPKLPFFTALGCDVGQMFAPEPITSKSVTEEYILAPTGGAIAMLSSSTVGYTTFHRPYLYTLYSRIAKRNYGATIGVQYQATYDSIMQQLYPPSNPSNFYFTHIEDMLLSGDPAIHLQDHPKPDYYVGDETIASIPAIVTTSLDSFKLRVAAYNIGRSEDDTVTVKVEHTNPAGVTTTVSTYRIPKLNLLDTNYVNVPVNHTSDLGLNHYKVTVDAPNQYDEMSEINNTGNLEVFIYSDDVVPVYPREFAIVYQQGVTLKASTLNAFHPLAHYRMQIDTTELFTNPTVTSFNSVGGLLKWQPPIQLHDSTVYYWRVAIDSNVNGALHWTGSSFIYLAQGAPGGWNQSHYFQWKKDNFVSLSLDSDRKFRFPPYTNTLQVHNTIMTQDVDAPNTDIALNNIIMQRSASNFIGVLQIMLINNTSGAVYQNTAAPGSLNPSSPAGFTSSTNVREYLLTTADGRDSAAHFLHDSIPNGYYVIIRNIIFDDIQNYYGHTTRVGSVDTLWKTETFPGISYNLHTAITGLGFNKIDSFNTERVFNLIRQKGNNSMPIVQDFGADSAYSIPIVSTYPFITSPNHGQMNSLTIGPALSWSALRWRAHSLDAYGQNDTLSVRVYGISPNNVETPLFTTNQLNYDLTGISATQYPTMRMEWYSTDSTTRTSAQQDFWRIIYAPAPEAALNPAAYFSFIDTAQAGVNMNMGIAVENLTDIPMDSMLMHYSIIGADGTTHNLPNIRYRKLPGNDTLHAVLSYDPAPYPGKKHPVHRSKP